MSYQSVDQLQKVLAANVFGYAKDKKKASGRALGTLVEIVTYYTACAWGLRNAIAIERSIPEFGNPEITHNVEFSLHPILSTRSLAVDKTKLPVSVSRMVRAGFTPAEDQAIRNTQLLTRHGIMRNAAVVAQGEHAFTTAHLDQTAAGDYSATLVKLLHHPFAIFECKRVGVEEGVKKGPQTIEKAKQGAYVARSVSSLQRFWLCDGRAQGILDRGSGDVHTGNYHDMLRTTIKGDDSESLRNFILTVGVVSNHGNWFTVENQNKEMKVLAQAYDWLLFLTDQGLSQFIERLLLSPVAELVPARDAFLASYTGDKSKKNRFTKVNVCAKADAALKRYFELHAEEIESWYNVISPKSGTLTELREDLLSLIGKDWKRIRNT